MIISNKGDLKKNKYFKTIIANLKPEKWKNDMQIVYWTDTKTKLISIPHISGSANGAKTKIINNFEECKPANKQKMLTYFIEKRLKNLMDVIEEF